jgi:hypothetical protein
MGIKWMGIKWMGIKWMGIKWMDIKWMGQIIPIEIGIEIETIRRLNTNSWRLRVSL